MLFSKRHTEKGNNQGILFTHNLLTDRLQNKGLVNNTFLKKMRQNQALTLLWSSTITLNTYKFSSNTINKYIYKYKYKDLFKPIHEEVLFVCMYFKGASHLLFAIWNVPTGTWACVCGSVGSSYPWSVLSVSGHISAVAQDDHRSVTWKNMEMPAFARQQPSHPLQSQLSTGWYFTSLWPNTQNATAVLWIWAA